MAQPSKEYHFATAEEIKALGVIENSEKLKEIISDHTFKILQETEIELEKQTQQALHSASIYKS